MASLPSTPLSSGTPTLSRSSSAADISTLHLPRLLFLHGGGTNSIIFHAQCRAIRTHISAHFRPIFAEAPYPCPRPGPDVLSVYADWGPFKSWFRLPADGSWGTHQDRVGVEEASAIDGAIETCVLEDNARGATGKVVGVLGFSQGAKLAASLLWREQVARKRGRHASDPSGRLDVQLKFAILNAGRPPLVSLNEHMEVPGVLSLPTLHVHGVKDAGLQLHRNLCHLCCEDGTTEVLEWEGDHRMAIKTDDVRELVERIVGVAKRTGVLEG